MSKLSVVHSDPEILGGTPVFRGTRVPLRNLFDYLERGHDIDEFLDAFQTKLNLVGDSLFTTFFALQPIGGAVTVNAQSQRSGEGKG